MRPLPPIVRYPYRLSSYVHLLGECSVKKFMYVHLKRHGLLPPHQLLEQERLGRRLAQEKFLCLSPQPSSDALMPLEMHAAERLAQSAESFDEKTREQSLGFSSPKSDSRAKRPALYDLILAAEHMGVDFKELLPLNVQRQARLAERTTESGAAADFVSESVRVRESREEDVDSDEELEGDGSPFLLQQRRVTECVLSRRLKDNFLAGSALQTREELSSNGQNQGEGAAALEKDEPPKEKPWYRPPFTVRGTFFRLRGNLSFFLAEDKRELTARELVPLALPCRWGRLCFCL